MTCLRVKALRERYQCSRDTACSSWCTWRSSDKERRLATTTESAQGKLSDPICPEVSRSETGSGQERALLGNVPKYSASNEMEARDANWTAGASRLDPLDQQSEQAVNADASLQPTGPKPEAVVTEHQYPRKLCRRVAQKILMTDGWEHVRLHPASCRDAFPTEIEIHTHLDTATLTSRSATEKTSVRGITQNTGSQLIASEPCACECCTGKAVLANRPNLKQQSQWQHSRPKEKKAHVSIGHV